MTNPIPQKLAQFMVDGQLMRIEYIETQHVKIGVECDVYKFLDDATRDLAVVKVLSGHKTPLQKVLKGSRTVEGFLDGAGTLSIIDDRGHTKSYDFASANTSREVIVRVGEVMQWAADSSTDLTFYEICEPPYEDGRFENIAE